MTFKHTSVYSWRLAKFTANQSYSDRAQWCEILHSQWNLALVSVCVWIQWNNETKVLGFFLFYEISFKVYDSILFGVLYAQEDEGNVYACNWRTYRRISLVFLGDKLATGGRPTTKRPFCLSFRWPRGFYPTENRMMPYPFPPTDV